MVNRVADLRDKEVINISDGSRLGFPCDVEVDIGTGQASALVVQNAGHVLGLFGRSEEYVVAWENIKRIGDDIILVEHPATLMPLPHRRRDRW